MTDETPTDERDASKTNYNGEDLDDAADQLDRDIEREGDDIPQSRRELAKEEASELLEAAEGNGVLAAHKAHQRARQQSQELSQQLEQARRTLNQMEEERRLAAAIERLLQDVTRKRVDIDSDAEDLATDGDPEDGED